MHASIGVGVGPLRAAVERGQVTVRAAAGWSAVRLIPLIATLLCLMWGAHRAAAEGYRLDTGDILRVTVYGEAAYPLQATVDDTGTVTLPLLGAVDARGHTIGALAAGIKEAFRARQILRDAFVQVVVEEYRPFFISGSVAKPGAYPFKPRMSISHALAIAGGFKAIRLGDKAPALTIADLKSDQVASLIEMFRYQVQRERLKAELNGAKKFVLPGEVPPELPADIIAEIMESEKSQFMVRRENFNQQVQHVSTVITESTRKADLVEQAKRAQEAAVKDQLAELSQARSMRGKGIMTNAAVLTAERTLNSYRTELAQIEVQASTHQQELIGLKNEVGKLEAARQLDIISQLQNAEIAIAKAKNKVKFLSDQLSFVATYGEHRSVEELRDVLRITIRRKSGRGSQAIVASEDTPVLADDIIEVAIVADSGFYSPVRAPAVATQ